MVTQRLTVAAIPGLGLGIDVAAQWCIHSAHEHDYLQRLSACNDYLLTRTIIYNDYPAPGPRHTHTNPPARMAPHPPPRIHTTEPHPRTRAWTLAPRRATTRARTTFSTYARSYTYSCAHGHTDRGNRGNKAGRAPLPHEGEGASSLRRCTSAPDVVVPAPGRRTYDMDFVRDLT